jgi:hypothetical protein
MARHIDDKDRNQQSEKDRRDKRNANKNYDDHGQSFYHSEKKNEMVIQDFPK